MADIPNTNEISAYIHCGLCVQDIKDGKALGVSPREYARLEIGYTKPGIQVWCLRHDCNVIHVDYEGKSPFPANLSRQGRTPEQLAEQVIEPAEG